VPEAKFLKTEQRRKNVYFEEFVVIMPCVWGNPTPHRLLRGRRQRGSVICVPLDRGILEA
jgi:hypothetical protein